MDGSGSYRRHAASMSSSTLPRFGDPAPQDLDSLWFVDSQAFQGSEVAASSFDPYRSAHDDLCIEDPKCPGMLPHGDPSAAFHRTDFSHPGSHSRQGFSTESLPNVPNWLQFGDPFTPDLPKYLHNQDLSISQPFLFNSCSLEDPISKPHAPTTTRDPDQSSVCNSICDSNCGDGDKCHGTSCADAQSVCSDENCPGVALSCTEPDCVVACTEADCPDAKAAVALTTFGDLGTQHDFGDPSQAGKSFLISEQHELMSSNAFM